MEFHGVFSVAQLRKPMVSVVTGLLLTIASAASSAGTLNFTSKIYDLKDRNKVLFTAVNEYEIKGDLKTYTSTFKDADGKVAAIETTTFALKNGSETLVSYIQDQKQLEALGKVEIVGDEAKFSYTRDGKTKTATEKVSGDFVVGPSLVSFLKSNWEKIAKGETVKARFVVVDRLETVGFQYFKEKEKDVQGKPGVVVKMKPSSFLIAAIVDPLHFAFDKDGQQLLELEGRTVVKIQKESKFKDFDGFTVYTHASAQPETKLESKSEVKTEAKPEKKK